jgi:glycine cleavage system H lipoate-binding protein
MFTLDAYMVKAVEYLVGLSFLVFFVLFWRAVNGGADEPIAEPVPAWSGRLSDWFRLPERVFFHPGHGWARSAAPGVMAVGVNDFAQHLVGPLQGISLPAPGTRLTAGGRGWALKADGKSFDMQAPVTGTVLEVNTDIANRPDLVNSDPYGRGWLLKLKVPDAKGALAALAPAKAARQWLERVSADLTRSMSPELGMLMQDGGVPVHGLAREMDEDHWEDIVRKYVPPPAVTTAPATTERA